MTPIFESVPCCLRASTRSPSTGPFEVLSRIPNSTYRLYGKTAEPVRDLKGLRLTPNAALSDAPQLDVLHVPGGFGQEALMEDAEVLAWIRQQAAGARSVFSVCTGALLCGAAGLLKGRRATTHWASFHLLPFSVRSPSTSGWSWTATGFSPPASRPASTAPCGSAELRGNDAANHPSLNRRRRNDGFGPLSSPVGSGSTQSNA